MTGADYAGWQITVIQLIVSIAGQKCNKLSGSVGLAKDFA